MFTRLKSLAALILLMLFMPITANAALPRSQFKALSPSKVAAIETESLKKVQTKSDAGLTRHHEATIIDCNIPSSSSKPKTKAGGNDGCYNVAMNFGFGDITQVQMGYESEYLLRLTSACPESVTFSNLSMSNVPSGLQITVSPQSFSIPGAGATQISVKFKHPGTVAQDPETWMPIGEYYFRLSWRTDVGTAYLNIYFSIIESPLPPEATGVVDILERGRGAGKTYTSILDKGLIAQIVPGNKYNYGYYLNGNGEQLTEENIASINASTFTKLGLTPDGQTRLMIRMQSTEPGSFYCALDGDYQGFAIESLYGHTITTGTGYMGIETDFLSTHNLYQATFVLVPPKDLGGEISRNFQIKVIQTDSNDDILPSGLFLKNLKLIPNPIVFVHGLWGDLGTFGKKLDDGIETNTHSLLSANGFAIKEHKYDGRRGPSESMLPNNTAFAADIYDAMRMLNDIGVACSKVDILAHSMGGLYTRRFLYDNEENADSIAGYGQGLVRRVITVATPHYGSEWVHFILGNFDNLSSEFTTQLGQSSLVRYVRDDRLTILRGLQALSLDGDEYFARLTWGNHAESETFDSFISAIEDLDPAGQFIRVLDLYAPVGSVPMYGISGNAVPGMDVFLASFLAVINDIGYLKVGDLHINTAMSRLGLEFVDLPQPFKQIITKMPTTATLGEATNLLMGIFGTEYNGAYRIGNDLVVANPSSQWIYGNHHQLKSDHRGTPAVLGRIASSHTEVTKGVPTTSSANDSTTGIAVKELLLGPESVFMLPPGSGPIVARLGAKNSSGEIAPKTKMSTEGAGKAKTETPRTLDIVQAIELEIPQKNILLGSQVLIRGQVTDEFQDGDNYIRVYFETASRRSGTSMSAKLDEKGHFEAILDTSKVDTGKYILFAEAGNATDDIGYTSNVIKDILVEPNIQQLKGLKFNSGRFYTSEGRTERLVLVATGDSKAWDVAHPMFGVTYNVEDPSIATITENGEVLGKKAGETIIHAFFRGQKASTTIAVSLSVENMTNPEIQRRSQATRATKKAMQSINLPQAPMPLEPLANATFRVGKPITFKATPLDTSKGHKFVKTDWYITVANSKARAARLIDGTESYAEWTPEKPGQYQWNMCYIYEDANGKMGMTDYSQWVIFTVTD